jgi:hypothetical protein
LLKERKLNKLTKSYGEIKERVEDRILETNDSPSTNFHNFWTCISAETQKLNRIHRIKEKQRAIIQGDHASRHHARQNVADLPTVVVRSTASLSQEYMVSLEESVKQSLHSVQPLLASSCHVHHSNIHVNSPETPVKPRSTGVDNGATLLQLEIKALKKLTVTPAGPAAPGISDEAHLEAEDKALATIKRGPSVLLSTASQVQTPAVTSGKPAKSRDHSTAIPSHHADAHKDHPVGTPTQHEGHHGHAQHSHSHQAHYPHQPPHQNQLCPKKPAVTPNTSIGPNSMSDPRSGKRASIMGVHRLHGSVLGYAAAGTANITYFNTAVLHVVHTYTQHGVAYIATMRVERDMYFQQQLLQMQIQNRLRLLSTIADAEISDAKRGEVTDSDSDSDDDSSSSSTASNGSAAAMNDSLASNTASVVHSEVPVVVSPMETYDRKSSADSIRNESPISERCPSPILSRSSIHGKSANETPNTSTVTETMDSQAIDTVASGSVATDHKARANSIVVPVGSGLASWLIEKAREKRLIQQQVEVEREEQKTRQALLTQLEDDKELASSKAIREAQQRIIAYRNKQNDRNSVLLSELDKPELAMYPNLSLMAKRMDLMHRKVGDNEQLSGIGAQEIDNDDNSVLPTEYASQHPIKYVSGNANVTGPYEFRGKVTTRFERYPTPIKG